MLPVPLLVLGYPWLLGRRAGSKVEVLEVTGTLIHKRFKLHKLILIYYISFF
jgi:hypothetical protein